MSERAVCPLPEVYQRYLGNFISLRHLTDPSNKFHRRSELKMYTIFMQFLIFVTFLSPYFQLQKFV